MEKFVAGKVRARRYRNPKIGEFFKEIDLSEKKSTKIHESFVFEVVAENEKQLFTWLNMTKTDMRNVRDEDYRLGYAVFYKRNNITYQEYFDRKQVISMPEHQTIEYKELWHDEFLEWICGYTNAYGGTLYTLYW